MFVLFEVRSRSLVLLKQCKPRLSTSTPHSKVPNLGCQNRYFSGRSSGSRKDRLVSQAAVESPSTTSEKAASSKVSQTSSSSSAGATGTGTPGTRQSYESRSAVLALPLFRRPAFPGFHQVLQVSEREVLDILDTLRKTGQGQGDYIGGFLTKSLPAQTSSSFEGGSTAAASRALRRDGGHVSSAHDLEEMGTLLQVLKITFYPNMDGGQILVMPRQRIRRTSLISQPSPHVPLAAVGFEIVPEPQVHEDSDAKIAHVELASLFKQLLASSTLHTEKFEEVKDHYDTNNMIKLCDVAAGISTAERHELQAVLAEADINERIRKVTQILQRDLNFVKLQSQVKSQAEEKVTREQKHKMLMEQMNEIQMELGIEKDDKQKFTVEFRKAIEGKVLPEEATKVINAEIAKLNSLEPSSAEFNVCRTYVEWLTCLPWGKFSEENRDITKAQTILDEDHYGLEDVKERILEHIAVSFLKQNVQGKIMCLVGPPGVGKTSIGKSVARALDRKFYRFSVGGMHDVAEIRGHRRTYVGAMPGKLIQCLKSTGCSNPVVLIDEIDKLGRDMRGDPSSALLEVLDPEQNSNFRDHYLDVPVDLSQILFLCTANVLETIPGPLLDRMEVIRIAGYIFEEKLAIASKYLIPQTKEQSGIGSDKIQLQEEALRKIIHDYAREAGVRHLRQLLEKLSRKVALDVVRSKATEVEKGPTAITIDNLSKYIGQPLHMSDKLFTGGTPPGVVMGLAWTSLGGATLYVEARGRLPDGRARGGIAYPGVDAQPAEQIRSSSTSESSGGFSGHMQVTGQLGAVMTESASISLTYSRLFVRELESENIFLDEAKIHLHVPEGATPKDGPSAGVTMTSALVSLALGQPLKGELAMTGEMTLMGKVLRVGGIKEKVIAAIREGVKTLLLPRQNEADFMELKEYLRAGLTVHFVDHFDDIYRLAFEDTQVPQLPFPSRGLPVVTVETPPTPVHTPDASMIDGQICV